VLPKARRFACAELILPRFVVRQREACTNGVQPGFGGLGRLRLGRLRRAFGAFEQSSRQSSGGIMISPLNGNFGGPIRKMLTHFCI
jgi:hypothetical protein